MRGRTRFVALGLVAVLAISSVVTSAQVGAKAPVVHAKVHNKPAGKATVKMTIQSTEPAAVQKLTKEVVEKALRQASPTNPHPHWEAVRIENLSVRMNFETNSTTVAVTAVVHK